MIRGSVSDGVFAGAVTGFLGADSAEIEADVIATLPLEEWMVAGEVRHFPSTEIRAQIDGADIGRIPWLCDYGSGPVSGTLIAKDLLTDNPVVGTVLDMPRLRLRSGGENGPELANNYRLHVRAGSTPERDGLSSCVILGIAGTERTAASDCRTASDARDGEMISRLRVPVTWTAGEALPSYTDGAPIRSWNDFRGVRIEPIVSLIPGIVAGDAVVDGSLELNGSWEEPYLSGGLDIAEGYVQIDSLGQHLEQIEGRIELHGTEAVFPADIPLRAVDGDGALIASGNIGLQGLIPRTIDLSVTAAAFPIRREGMVLASLTGAVTIGGAIRDDRAITRIDIHGGNAQGGVERDRFLVRLPEQTAATLQALEPHGEVLIVGTERPGLPGASDAYPIEIQINARDPFWVRRNDFAAQVQAELDAEYRDELRVTGVAVIRRGTFEIFGKRFDLTEGQLSFGGGEELDPDVHIVAVYSIPGRSEATVTVTVSGRLTQPRIRFSSTETGDRAEIIALLVSGGRRQSGTAEREASEQAASFLAGLTAGILTLGLRQEFGDVIPVFAIESEGASGTRFRAGFDANEIIPDFLRGVVTGAYIEGFLTAAADGTNSAGSSSGGGGVGGGVSIELNFPENVLFRGSYVPVDNGSVDLLWEP